MGWFCRQSPVVCSKKGWKKWAARDLGPIFLPSFRGCGFVPKCCRSSVYRDKAPGGESAWYAAETAFQRSGAQKRLVILLWRFVRKGSFAKAARGFQLEKLGGS